MAYTALSRPPARQLPLSPKLQTLQDFEGDFMKLTKHVDDNIKFKNLSTQMAKCQTTEPKTLEDFDGDTFRFSKQLEGYV